MANGGKRPGAGRPKGSKNQGTLEKEALRERLRALVAAKWDAMIDAQIKRSLGTKYLIARHKTTGKFVKLTKSLLASILSGKEDHYDLIEVWSKEPCTSAFQDLANRTIDKPAEQLVIEGEIDNEIVLRWKTDKDEEDEE